LISTRNYALVYDGSEDAGLLACSDSDWGADTETSHSQTGFFLKLANAAFLWNSHQQDVVARSSTEAEYISMSDCTAQIIGIKQMLQELGFTLKPIPLCGDNQGAIFLAQNPVNRKNNRHIRIKYHFIRDAVQVSKDVELFYIAGEDNPADIFTKNLGYIKFEKFRSLLGLTIYRDN
jgi:hypothetical protein